MKSALRRLEREAGMWRQEPMKRVAARNRLLRPLRVRQFGAFGEHATVDRPIWLYGAKKMSIGDRAIILRGTWLAVERVAWDIPGFVLNIGNDFSMRVGGTISASSSVTIEDDVSCGAYVSIVDSAHTWNAGNPNPLHNPSQSSPIRIGAGTWLADRATVAAGAEIGLQCLLAANCVVSGKVADYSIVVGNPGRVVGSTRT
jgi:acetyltransferase-like isoleucine patch superfamily enzyme